MKKVIFTKVVFTLLILAAGLSFTHAQSRLQIIHNAAAAALDTVDIYVDGQLVNDVNFRSATRLLNVASGVVSININAKTSTDSGNAVLARFTVNTVAGQTQVAMVMGVDNPANYAANPNGIATDVRLVVANNINLAPVVQPNNQARTGLTIFHGSTDAPGVSVEAKPNATLASNARFGDAAANIIVNPTATLIDITDSIGTNTLFTYNANLTLFQRRSIVVFASGFLNPAANQNGSGFGLFVVDTSGGNATALPTACRYQIIHNILDTIAGTVDVYLNNTRVADDLPFRSASAMSTATPGTYNITISKRGSANPTDGNQLVQFSNVSLAVGKTYVILANGLVDTTKSAANPDGMPRGASLDIIDNFSEGGITGQVNVAFAHGAVNAPSVDLNEITLPTLTKVADNAQYKSISVAVNIPSTNNVFNLTTSDSSTILGTYRLNLSALSGRAGVIFASGLLPDTFDLTKRKPFGLFFAAVDGSVREVVRVVTRVQIVHNSADVTLDSVDIYVNGAKKYSNVKFAQATPSVEYLPLSIFNVGFARAGSASINDTIASLTFQLDTFTNYILMPNGVINTSLYAPNPNGRNIGFRIAQYKGARVKAEVAKNVDLLFYQGATDLQMITMRGFGQVQFLSKDDVFGDFHGYAVHSAQENIRFELKDALADIMIGNLFGSIANHQGDAGLVFASGFKRQADNNNGKPCVFYIAWPDGDIDTMAYRFASVGMNEQNILASTIATYPNPASEKVVVAFSLPTAQPTMAKVYDITGKLVESRSIDTKSGLNEMILFTQSYPNGIYLLEIHSGEQKATQKIVINH